MPPRPFPHMLSVGNDICHHRRFFKYFEGKECEEKMFRMLDKVLLPSEQRMFWRKFQSLEQLWGLSNNRRDAAAEYIGGRWAAKEAIVKAFACNRRILIRQIEVRSDVKTRQPYGIVHDKQKPPPKTGAAIEIYKAFINKAKPFRKLDVGAKGGEGEAEARRGFVIEDGKLDLNAMHAALAGEEEVGEWERQQSGRETEVEREEKGPSIRIRKIGVNEPKTGIYASAASVASRDLAAKKQADATALEAKSAEDAALQSRSEDEEGESAAVDEEDSLEKIQGQIVRLSISHDGTYSMATALAHIDSTHNFMP